MLLAMMMAAGSRAGDAGPGPDLGGRAIVCLGGFPAINSPIWKTHPARRSRRYNRLKIFNYDNNIENSIVNNIKGRYHLKKGVKYHLKKRAGSLYRDRAKGETA